MSAWKYKRLMPKVIVAKMRLIDSKDLVNMIGQSFDAVSSMLANTSYRQDILGIPSEQFSSFSLENALLKNFARTYEEIVECSPKDVRSLPSTIQMKFEVSIVKAMLRAKEANISVDEAMKYITPVRKLDEARCREILESSVSTRDLVEALLGLEYGVILKETLSTYEGTNLVLELENALDRHVYGKIWKAVGKLRGLDKKIAKAVVGIEIDSVNIKIILRCRVIGMNENQIRGYLFPVSEVFSEKNFENALKAADVKSSLESLLVAARLARARDYQYVLNDLLKEYESSQSFSQLETVLDRGLLKTSLRMLKRYTPFFNIGLILAFLNLKWFEIRNLRAIIKGIEDKISPDRIRRSLILSD